MFFTFLLYKKENMEIESKKNQLVNGFSEYYECVIEVWNFGILSKLCIYADSSIFKILSAHDLFYLFISILLYRFWSLSLFASSGFFMLCVRDEFMLWMLIMLYFVLFFSTGSDLDSFSLSYMYWVEPVWLNCTLHCIWHIHFHTLARLTFNFEFRKL